jgi:hypothetical protein
MEKANRAAPPSKRDDFALSLDHLRSVADYPQPGTSTQHTALMRTKSELAAVRDFSRTDDASTSPPAMRRYLQNSNRTSSSLARLGRNISIWSESATLCVDFSGSACRGLSSSDRLPLGRNRRKSCCTKPTELIRAIASRTGCPASTPGRWRSIGSSATSHRAWASLTSPPTTRSAIRPGVSSA